MESRYGWVLVALGGLMGCVAAGAMFSLAVFLEPMSVDTGWGRAGISSAMSLNFIAMGLGSFAWGMASDRWGPRGVLLAGSVIMGLALVLASRAATLGAFQLTFGVLVGVATSAFFAPMMAAVTGWFDKHRALAISLVSAGVGMAPLTMSPLAQWLVTTHGWRPAMLTIGIVAWALLLPAAWLVRAPKTSPAPVLQPSSQARPMPRSVASAI